MPVTVYVEERHDLPPPFRLEVRVEFPDGSNERFYYSEEPSARYLADTFLRVIRESSKPNPVADPPHITDHKGKSW